MTKTELVRLAAMASSLRPDWPARSVLTFLTKEVPMRAYRDVAVALAYVACDEATTTPKRLLEPGPWWLTTRVGEVTPLPPRFGPVPVLTDAEREAAQLTYRTQTLPALADALGGTQ